MDGWGIIAVLVTVVVCGILIVAGGKSRIGHHHHVPEDHTHNIGFSRRDAKLLGTIPSEDDVERKSPERDVVLELEGEDDHGIDLRHQHPHAYRYMDDEPKQRKFTPQESIEQCISKEMVDNHREEANFAVIEDEVAVERVIAEAHDLVRDLNHEFGQELFELRIADRLFNTNVHAVLAAAKASKKIDFRTMRMIVVMRQFGRAANGGRSELAKVMAARMLLGTGRLTAKELESLDHARRLFGDEFAEAAGYVDHLSRTEEIVAARRLGVTVKESPRDRPQAPPVDIERNAVSRSLDRRSF
jgi:hypothetical protein